MTIELTELFKQLEEKGYDVVTNNFGEITCTPRFKDGDIIAHDSPSGLIAVAILKGRITSYSFYCYAGIDYYGDKSFNEKWNGLGWRYATEEEKQEFFNRLKESNNVVWNAVTKRLEKIQPKKTWENIHEITGYFIGEDSKISSCDGNCEDKNVAASEEVCKSMLAMAQISQIMKKWYNPFTDEELANVNLTKYAIEGYDVYIKVFLLGVYYKTKSFLLFHSKEEREDFIENNRQLLLDYFMVVE